MTSSRPSPDTDRNEPIENGAPLGATRARTESGTNATRPSAGRRWTRRDALVGLGTTIVVGLAGCLGGDSGIEHGWNEVDSGTEAALYDVVMTTDGPLAVGEGGQVRVRRDTDWTAVTKDGPSGASNELLGAATTADRRAAWFCGSSGAIGRYAVADRAVADHTAPGGKTSSWADVAVNGPTGRERVYLINSSGELLSGRMSPGGVSWGDVTKPAGGLSTDAIAYASGIGFVADGDGDVYRSTGDRWNRIGIDGANTTLRDVIALEGTVANAVGDDGSIYLYDGFNWLSLAASEQALHAIDRAEGRGLAAGVGGTVYELADNRWQSRESPTEATFHGVAIGSADHSDVAVGANGTIAERFA